IRTYQPPAQEQSRNNIPILAERRKPSGTAKTGGLAPFRYSPKDFPPKQIQQKSPPPGIPSQIFAAREQRAMTRYELGKIANVPSTVVRAIEQGDDVPLSQFHAVVTSLGLVFELVEHS
ncbi:MAG: helix-turn-helix transcriptional regulator, partial [Betaproteobacteria bacterium]